jgi:hypothetical protein
MDRPAGVTILGILGIIGGAGAVLLGLLFMLGSEFLANRLAGGQRVFFAGLAGVGGILFLLFGVFELVVAIGLLNLANWARLITMIGAAIGLVLAALGTFGAAIHFFPVLITRRMVAGAIDALILWYFSQPNVKQAFSPQAPVAPGAPPAATIPPAPPAPPLPPSTAV